MAQGMDNGRRGLAGGFFRSPDEQHRLRAGHRSYDAFRLRWSIARARYPFDGENASYYTGTIGFEGYF